MPHKKMLWGGWDKQLTLVYFVLIFLIFGKKFSYNQNKWELFYNYFKPVSAIQFPVVKLSGTLPCTSLGRLDLKIPCCKTWIDSVTNPNVMKKKLSFLVKKGSNHKFLPGFRSLENSKNLSVT